MKKLLKIALCALLVFGMAACGTPGGDTKDDRIRLVYIINGTLGDKSFFDSGKEGLDLIDAKYGDKVYTEYRELTYDDSTWEQKAQDIVAEGWDIVIAGTYDMLGYFEGSNGNEGLATKYPDTKFWFFDESWDFTAYPNTNVYGMLFSQNEGSFAVGVIAAMTTKTNKVAFEGGMDNTVLDDFFVGFYEGVKYEAAQLGKEITVTLDWMNSFSDSTVGKDKAGALYNQGYDVVFACGGSAGLGVFDAAVEYNTANPNNPVYVIGVDGDQGAYFGSLSDDLSKSKASCTVTSMQKNVNQGFLYAMGKHLDNTLPYGQVEHLGLNGGFVSASVNDYTKAILSNDQITSVNAIVDQIVAGTLTVDSMFGDKALTQDQFKQFGAGTWVQK